MKALTIILLIALICGCTDTPTGNAIAIPTTSCITDDETCPLTTRPIDLSLPLCTEINWTDVLVDANTKLYKTIPVYHNGTLLTEEEIQKGCRTR